MALSGIKPFVHVSDSNGNPYVGAKLYVYAPGTTTPLSIYSDAALSVSIANPMTGANASDAAGNFPRFYLAAGTYKLRAETSVGVLIWQYDNIDTGLSAGSGALPVASGGTGGTTATAARTNLDVPSNSQLTALSTTITTLQATIQSLAASPQGRLTLTSATPVLTTGVTAGTSVYYTPYVGDLVPIYDGSLINTLTFAELTLTLNSNHVANSIYDAFVFSNSGAVTLGTGPAWNTVTAGSGARGTGAATTELSRTIGGFWTNAVAATLRNGATTYSVNVNCATYVGTIYMDGTNGQISCLTAYGQSRKWGVWNAYNRVPIVMQMGDPTASWSYNSAATVREARAQTTNVITVLTGLAESPIKIIANQNINGNASSPASMGIGWNSTVGFSGMAGQAPSNSQVTGCSVSSQFVQAPSLGINNVTANEIGNAGAPVFLGGIANMLFTTEYPG